MVARLNKGRLERDGSKSWTPETKEGVQKGALANGMRIICVGCVSGVWRGRVDGRRWKGGAVLKLRFTYSRRALSLQKISAGQLAAELSSGLPTPPPPDTADKRDKP